MTLNVPLLVLLKILSDLSIREKSLVMPVCRQFRTAVIETFQSKRIIRMIDRVSPSGHTGHLEEDSTEQVDVYGPPLTELEYWESVLEKFPNVNDITIDSCSKQDLRPLFALLFSKVKVKRLKLSQCGVGLPVEWTFDSKDLESLHYDWTISGRTLQAIIDKSPKLTHVEVYNVDDFDFSKIPSGLKVLQITHRFETPSFNQLLESPAADSLTDIPMVWFNKTPVRFSQSLPNLKSFNFHYDESSDGPVEDLAIFLSQSPKLKIMKVAMAADKVISKEKWRKFLSRVRGLTYFKLDCVKQDMVEDAILMLDNLQEISLFLILPLDWVDVVNKMSNTPESLSKLTLTISRVPVSLKKFLEISEDKLKQPNLQWFRLDSWTEIMVEVEAIEHLERLINTYNLTVTAVRRRSEGLGSGLIQDIDNFREKKWFRLQAIIFGRDVYVY